MEDILSYYHTFQPISDPEEYLEMISGLDETFLKFSQEKAQEAEANKALPPLNKGKRK